MNLAEPVTGSTAAFSSRWQYSHRQRFAYQPRRQLRTDDFGIDCQLRRDRCFIRGAYPGKLADLPGRCLGIETLGIALRADGETGAEEHFKEIIPPMISRACWRWLRSGEMNAATTHRPLRLASRATSAARRMFSVRSSCEKPRSRLRPARISSPSSSSAGWPPASMRSRSAWLRVVLPAPDSPR